jgi:hypothetical protein
MAWALHPVRLFPGWVPGPVWTGTENLTPTGIRSPDRPVFSESQYRLSSPGPCIVSVFVQKYTAYLHMKLQYCLFVYFFAFQRLLHFLQSDCVHAVLMSLNHGSFSQR